jgi:hypothetical protein
MIMALDGGFGVFLSREVEYARWIDYAVLSRSGLCEAKWI